MTNEKIMSTICDSICRHPYRVESQAELDILCEDCVVNKLEASDGDLIIRADIPYHKQLEPMGNGQYTEVEVAYKDDIESLPSASAEAVQGWIPCSERLPENGHYYLWCSDMGSVQSDYYWNGFENGTKYGYNIIAWMPMPKPYVESEVEE